MTPRQILKGKFSILMTEFSLQDFQITKEKNLDSRLYLFTEKRHDLLDERKILNF